MKTLITAAAAAMTLTGFASAATIDIQDFIDRQGGFGEQGVASGTVLNIDGLNIMFSANSTYSPYFDRGRAGVGVCQVLDSAAQCTPSSDDNVTMGEAITLTFTDGAQDLSDFVLRGANHALLAAGMIGLQFEDANGLVKSYNWDVTTDLDLTGIVSITLAYLDAQFYLSSFNATPFNGVSIIDNLGNPVPVPGALVLFGTALAGGAAARRKRNA